MSSKQHITAFIEANKDIFTQLNDAVWESPELGFLEYRSSQTLHCACVVQEAVPPVWSSGVPVSVVPMPQGAFVKVL